MHKVLYKNKLYVTQENNMQHLPYLITHMVFDASIIGCAS